jgi:acetyl esterase
LKSEIHAQILLYPTLDSSFEAASWREMSDNPIANPKVSGELNHLYARSRADEETPQFSPLKASDLNGLAPCFVFAGSQDAAKGDGDAYVAKMKAAGGEATYREFKGAIHGFLNMTDVLEESRQLHDEIRAVIHKF